VYLTKVGKYYYFRKRVPSRFIKFLGYRELKISCQTSDYKTALSTVSIFYQEFESILSQMNNEVFKDMFYEMLRRKDEQIRDLVLEKYEILPRPGKVVQCPQSSVLLSTIIENFVREKVSSGRWNEQNAYEAQKTYNQFLEIIGDKDVSKYTRNDIVSYVESLQKLPKNVNKMAKLKGKSIPEILSMSHNYPLMDTTTINMRLTRVNSAFVYAKN
jgi:hypothetical protein